jgi:hypothetical protein
MHALETQMSCRTNVVWHLPLVGCLPSNRNLSDKSIKINSPEIIHVPVDAIYARLGAYNFC